MKFSQLVDLLKEGEIGIVDYNLALDPDISGASSIDNATTNQISFLEEDSYLYKQLSLTKASIIIIPDRKEIKDIINQKSIAWVTTKNPKHSFAEVLELLYPENNISYTIHRSSVIDSTSSISKEVYVGPNVSIGSNCQISLNCIIHPGVVIYENVSIGQGTILHANCVIHRNSIIGDNCIIHSNAVIGSEGFGFIPTPKGWRKMPQTGKVIIENYVEIGSSSTIDRPSVGETYIAEGTKLDNLVQIGHGVKIGKNCAIAAQVGIAGGAIIEDGVILAGQVGVANRIKVGQGAIASSKTGITSDVEAGTITSGFPNIPNKLWLRCSANFKRLPELAKTIRSLSSSDKN